MRIQSSQPQAREKCFRHSFNTSPRFWDGGEPKETISLKVEILEGLKPREHACSPLHPVGSVATFSVSFQQVAQPIAKSASVVLQRQGKCPLRCSSFGCNWNLTTENNNEILSWLNLIGPTREGCRAKLGHAETKPLACVCSAS